MAAPFVWFDLAVTDNDAGATAAFYSELFGWSSGPGVGDYHSWVNDGDQPWAGVLPVEPRQAGRWVPFVPVADLDAAVARATALGGTAQGEKVTGPAGTTILVADPSGAQIALFTPAE
ncbi:VOC family protein [Cryptosporangium japonicum]